MGEKLNGKKKGQKTLFGVNRVVKLHTIDSKLEKKKVASRLWVLVLVLVLWRG